jgi:hypothetical protein
MAGITGQGKGILGHTQGHARKPKKKHSMFSRAYAKRAIFEHNSLNLLMFL